MTLKTIYPELLLQLLSSRGEEADALVLREVDHTALGSTGNFLSSRLKYVTDAHGQEICLLQDGDTEVGVMMGWERGISTFCSYRRGCMLRGGSNLSARNGAPDVQQSSQSGNGPENSERWLWSGNCRCTPGPYC